jgi:predicted ATPase
MNTVDETSRKVLEQRARKVIEHCRRRDTRVVLEFAGSPKSGKTTNIDIVTHFFKRMGAQVWAPTEGASKRTPYHLRRDLVAFNTWSLNYAISELLVAYYNVDRQDIVILDRGPFDSLAWMRLLHDRGDLSQEEYQIIERFALHPKWWNLVRRVFLFTCTPDVSMARENESKLTHGPGTAMNTETLQALLSQYKQLHQQYCTRCPVYPIDTSETTSPLESAKTIVEEVLSAMEQEDPQG